MGRRENRSKGEVVEQRNTARISGDDPLARRVGGTFYRAVDPAYEEFALAGSRSAGRYSPPDVPTLYLSASSEGVTAAMIAHSSGRSRDLQVMEFDVDAVGIVDLRTHDALRRIGINPDDTAADWQDALANGAVPSSWRVREVLERRGASGVIDPSRKRPGLWHLTLFRWNREGAPTVHGSSHAR